MNATHAPTRMFSTVEAAGIVGATIRQVDFDARLHLVRPVIGANGSGSRRRWSAEQLPVLMLIRQLRALGASQEAVRRAIDEAGDPGGWESKHTFWLSDEAGYVVDLEAMRRKARDAIGGES